MSTSDTAVPSREDKTHVPEPSAATLLHDGASQAGDAAAGQTFVVSDPPRSANGQGTTGAESQTLIAPDGASPDDQGGDFRFGATVVADAGTPHNGFDIGATVVGDDRSVQATRQAEVLSSFDASQQAGDLEIEPGDSLIAGKFRVIKTLGEGSFGAVYLAEDPKLDRRVAIKITKVGVLTTRSDVDRFQREARAAAQLRHPNIVPVYDTGSIGRSSYLVYEYIEGQTLGSRLKAQKRLEPRDAAQVMLAISGALGYAHELGIIHRDMKPDNVLLDKQGQPHIADFGLARRDSGEMDKTREGGLMGTPLYMSPEQASGRSHEADARADVWSLGVMLREMLTGVLPFQGKLTEILIAIQTVEPPSIRALDPSLPKDLETICQKCLSKDAALRYANGTELAAELDRYLRGEPILARPLSTVARIARWVRRNPKGAIVMAALLCAAVVSTLAVISAKQEQTRRALGLSRELTSAAASSVPSVIERLRLDRDIVATPLQQDLAEDNLPPIAKNRLQLAMATLFPQSATPDVAFESLAETLVTLPAEEVEMQVTLLEQYGYGMRIVSSLREIADNEGHSQAERRMSLYALATLDPTAESWEADAADVAAGLLATNAFDLSAVLSLVRPIQNLVTPELESHFDEAESGAAGVLASTYADDPEGLFALARRATSDQLRPLITAMRLHRETVGRLANADLAIAGTESSLSAPALRSRTNAFIVLYAVAPDSVTWDVLAGGVDDSLRTEIIHGLPLAVPEWKPAADRLQSEPNPLVRQALLQMLANFSVTDLMPEDRAALVPSVIELFNTDGSPAVHSAARWFLQRVHGVAVDASAPVSAEQRGDRDWFRDSLGNEFAIVEGPVEFLMGAAPDDIEQDITEQQHQRLIPRSFAIAMREVKVSDYQRFDPDYVHDTTVSPTVDCPASNVSWLDAAKYCRWLSEQEGIPENEMCYPPVAQIVPEMTLPSDVLQRTGYRLPTAAEWEFACRGGVSGSRPFGATKWADRFAWFDHELSGTQPVGLLEPNRLGLFDTLGNLSEWCFDWFFDEYPSPGEGAVVLDGAVEREGIYKEIRGGSYRDKIQLVRTPYRDSDEPEITSFAVGFRLARTIRDEQ